MEAAMPPLVAAPRGVAVYNTGARTVSRAADGLELSMERFSKVCVWVFALGMLDV
jgi:hypothetical protein